MTYEQFLDSKKHQSENFGIEPKYLPNCLFDFQKKIAEHAIIKGRCGVFVDTGLGKTLVQLVTAVNYLRYTNKPVLIITPLAVAFQFIREAEKFNIEASIEYSKDGKYQSEIVLCNYERLDKFSPEDFDCVILDESSILKNFQGAIRQQVTTFMKRTKYRFLSTATPSPNDFIELGTSSEALGYMPYMEMLQKFFANNENNIRPQEIGTKWYIKPHAVDDFFKWVGSWSISVKQPSDLGFSDVDFVLPELKKKYHFVKNDKNWVVDGQVLMFGKMAKTMTEVRQEQQMTIENRCTRAAELSANHDTSVYWCNFNKEGDLLASMDKEAYQIKGSMNIDQKEDILLGFLNGDIKKLITKPKMTAFGLNWQHCNHTTYFPTWSYEQYYQAIRRFWRFGQKNDVTVDLILSDGQKRVTDALEYKTDKAIRLFEKLKENTNTNFGYEQKQFTNPINLPAWI